MTRVRTRFAPSPTGRLHLGNLRIAVFNQLFARHHGGDFVLRVEDTDAGRTQEGSLEAILDDLRWAGLEWDEGPERPGPFAPYHQSEREPLHRRAAERLHADGLAYLCFCDETAIEAARADPEVVGPGCPGGCRDLSSEKAERRRAEGESPTLRFAVPDGTITIEDAIRGEVSFHGRDVSDFVVLRADGRPTYNLAVVVDDIAMEISHVIRGAGHLSNTPKQHLLFLAMDARPPVFAHLPTVLGEDRKKLSKREGSAALTELRERGFHPDGVVNYVSLLGWSPGDDREILTRDELVRAMTLDRVGASDTVFDPEKLLWCSEQHIALMSLEELTEAVRPFITSVELPIKAERLPLAVDAVRTRLSVFSDIVPALELLYPGDEKLRAGWRELLEDEDAGETIVAEIQAALAEVEPFTAESINRRIRERGKEIGARGPSLFHPVRLALMGTRSGPDMGGIMVALGRDEVIRRLQPHGPGV
ncbi:MAG: glutamate--tRNA ligase [Gemmatimonadales bacterium]|nr:MAG: glutamate--tRNA ligase [Gemmatimonadales bacterium]